MIYPCVMLNADVKAQFSNHQYQTLVDPVVCGHSVPLPKKEGVSHVAHLASLAACALSEEGPVGLGESACS